MKRLFAIALLFAGLAARAQETPTVTARVEPDSIMIGDRLGADQRYFPGGFNLSNT